MPSAVIIGGGPAGSTAAILLARSGWAITLVEQHRFPRDKVCGECLSALGAEVLGRLGLFDDARALGAVRLGRTLLHAPDGTCVDAKLPRPMWGVSRIALDGLMLDAAANAGARLRQPARCESIKLGERPCVRVRDLVTNAVESLDADYVLLADGKSALLDGSPPPPSGDLGIKAHFHNVDGPRDAVELFGLTGCYGGLAPIEGGRWNAAFSVPASRVRRHGGNLSRLFAELLTENSTLRHRLANAHQLRDWLASPLPRFPVRARWPQRVIPLGNAAAAIEPIGGEGMGLAMRSAEIAAARVSGSFTADVVRGHYRRLWRSRSVGCRAGALAAGSPRLATASARALRLLPSALGPVMKLIGK
jgi:2-polyprenyl-6-methoxyphenol hydroxylase-like FAD-dependent oxidoreductase